MTRYQLPRKGFFQKTISDENITKVINNIVKFAGILKIPVTWPSVKDVYKNGKYIIIKIIVKIIIPQKIVQDAKILP